MGTESAPVRCVVLGAGLRGRQVYGRQALDHPERLRVVALAEPLRDRRESMAPGPEGCVRVVEAAA